MQKKWRSFAGKRIITMLLVSYFGWSNLYAAEDFSPWDWWSEGCKAYEKGEQNRKFGSYGEALSFFQQARQSFLDVKKERPDWNQKIIDARIALCDREIIKVKALIKERQKSGSDTFDNMVDAHVSRNNTNQSVVNNNSRGMANTPGRSNNSVAYNQLRDQYSATRLRELKLDNENKDLRNRLAQAQKNSAAVADLLKEQRILQEKNVFLTQQLKVLENKLNQPDDEKNALTRQLMAAREEIDQLKKSLSQNGESIKQLNKDIDLLKFDLNTAQVGEKAFREQIKKLGDECGKLKNDLTQIQDAFRQERSEKNRLDGENNELRRQLDVGKNDLKQLQKNLDDLRTVSADKQKLELSIMEENNALKKSAEKFKAGFEASSQQQKILQDKFDELNVMTAQLKGTLSSVVIDRDRLKNENKAYFDALDRQQESLRKNEAEIKALNDKLARNEKDFKAIMLDNEALRKQANSAARGGEDKIALLNTVIDQQRKEIEQLRVSNAGIAADYDAVAKRMKTAEATSNELEKQIAELNNANAVLKLKSETASVESSAAATNPAQVENLQRELNAVKRELEATRRSAAAGEHNQLKIQELEEKLKLMDKMRKDLFELQQKNQSLAAEVTAIDGLKLEQRRLTLESTKLRQQLNEAKVRLANFDDLQKAADKLAALQTETAQLKRENQLLQAESNQLAQMKIQLAAYRNLEAKQLELLKQNGELEHTVGDLKNQVAGLKNKVDLSPSGSAPESGAQIKILQESMQKQRESFEAERKLTSESIAKLQRNLQQAERKLQQKINENRDSSLSDAKFELEIADLNKKIDSLTQLAAYMRQERDDYAAKYRELQNRSSEDANIYVIEFLSEEQLAELLKTGLEAEAKEHYEVAIWHFQKILERLPNHFEANYHLGEILNRRERFADSEKLLQRAVKIMPEHLEANMALIRSLAGQNKFGNAFQILQPLLKNSPSDGKMLSLASDVAFRGGDYAAAEKYALEELAQNPKSPECNLLAAKLLTRKGDEENLAQAGKYYQSAKQNGALPDLDLEEKLSKYMVEKLEVVDFMRNGAAEALEKQDYLAVSWYYGELFKLQPATRLYQDLFRYYSIKGGNAEDVMLDWKIPEDDVISVALAAWGFFKLNDPAEAKKWFKKLNAIGGLEKVALPDELKELPNELKTSVGQLPVK